MSPEYHRAKAEIMTPIHDFLVRVESRTAAEVVRLRRRGERLHLVAIVGLGTAVVLGLVSFALLARPRVMALFRLARPVSGQMSFGSVVARHASMRNREVAPNGAAVRIRSFRPTRVPEVIAVVFSETAER